MVFKIKGDEKMKGKYLTVGDIFVIVGRGESPVYRKISGGMFEELISLDNPNLSKFRKLPDLPQKKLKQKLKSCGVVKIDRIRTGLSIKFNAILFVLEKEKENQQPE